MIWVRTDEERFYRNTGTDLLLDELRKMKKIPDAVAFSKIKPVVLPESAQDIRNTLASSPVSKAVVISPKYPSDFGYDDYGFFTLVELPSDGGILTSEQLEMGIDEDTVLTSRLGLRVMKPSTTFADMAGAKKLLEDTDMMIRLEALERAIGGLFLFGVPGTGKSYFAECFAGQTGRHLVEMDLSFIINTANPTRTIDNVFDFLYSRSDMKFVLWIDEIEKMYDMQNLKAKQVFGKLLTKLNEVAKEEMKHIVFVATANKIIDIMKNNPEFLRKGRFRKLYFLNFPKPEDATDIIGFYLKRAKKKFRSELMRTLKRLASDPLERERFAREGREIFRDCLDFVSSPQNVSKLESDGGSELDELVEKYSVKSHPNDLYREIDIYYPMKQVKKRFIYTPSEIKVFVDELVDLTKLDPKNESENVRSILSEVIPLQISMKDAISGMVSQAKDAGDTNSKIFVEV